MTSSFDFLGTSDTALVLEFMTALYFLENEAKDGHDEYMLELFVISVGFTSLSPG